jgi:hypothetical protein
MKTAAQMNLFTQLKINRQWLACAPKPTVSDSCPTKTIHRFRLKLHQSGTNQTISTLISMQCIDQNACDHFSTNEYRRDGCLPRLERRWQDPCPDQSQQTFISSVLRLKNPKKKKGRLPERFLCLLLLEFRFFQCTPLTLNGCTP